MPPTMTYEQFIKQPNWEDILYHNYLTRQPPPTYPIINTINNDIDQFTPITALSPDRYLSRLPEPARGYLTKALILKTKNSRYAYMYARDVIHGRWPEAEETIRQNPQWAYYYARDVIHGRWPEAEGIISMIRTGWL